MISGPVHVQCSYTLDVWEESHHHTVTCHICYCTYLSSWFSPSFSSFPSFVTMNFLTFVFPSPCVSSQQFSSRSHWIVGPSSAIWMVVSHSLSSPRHQILIQMIQTHQSCPLTLIRSQMSWHWRIPPPLSRCNGDVFVSYSSLIYPCIQFNLVLNIYTTDTDYQLQDWIKYYRIYGPHHV